MMQSLMYIVIALFIGLFIFQFYFRLRIVNVYRRLVKNRVQFDASHVFNAQKMKDEVVSKYPQHEADILKFSREIRLSVTIASFFILLLIAAGYILRS